jgi:mannosyltransferase OCH1-like enzyme
MRSRVLIALVALVAFCIVLSLRQHMYDLGEMLRTYSTFHHFLRRHPDILYRYPGPATSDSATSPTKLVPKIIHHIALGSGANLGKYASAIESCRNLHPDWDHRFWTDANATSFVSVNYPEIFPHYTGYLQNIQRANILRYALVHTFGGVYLDLDITCLASLDSTSLLELPFITAGAYPAGVNNAFIAAQRGHPFLTELLRSVPRHDLYWGLPMRMPYVENMLTTGCMFFSNRWMAYARSMISGRKTERIFILADEKGNINPHMLRGKTTTPLFAHGGASSWHSWDAALVLWVGKHYGLFIAFFAVGIALAVLSAVSMCTDLRRRGRFRRRSWGFNVARRTKWIPIRLSEDDEERDY